MQQQKKYNWIILIPVILTGIFLSIVQLKASNPLILLERFIKNGGWVEILILSLYAGFLFYKMSDSKQTANWRRISWNIFSGFFFLQLTLGLLGIDEMLMTGDLHIPIPAVILSGPLYRMQIGFMPILFLSTVLLSGPAWCSHLCYFGALDNQLASGKRSGKKLANKNLIKHLVLLLVITTTIILRIFHLPILYAIILASAFGIIGVLIILGPSSKQNKMIHCISYCPIGTIIMYAKYISPFRMRINSSCDSCMACTTHCKYDALGKNDISSGKPGHSCTLCGDCLPSCSKQSIEYRFLGLSPKQARNLYLIITITLHVTFLGVARM